MVGGGNKNYKISSNMVWNISGTSGLSEKAWKSGDFGVEVKSLRSLHWTIHLWLVKW